MQHQTTRHMCSLLCCAVPGHRVVASAVASLAVYSPPTWWIPCSSQTIAAALQPPKTPTRRIATAIFIPPLMRPPSTSLEGSVAFYPHMCSPKRPSRHVPPGPPMTAPSPRRRSRVQARCKSCGPLLRHHRRSSAAFHRATSKAHFVQDVFWCPRPGEHSPTLPCLTCCRHRLT